MIALVLVISISYACRRPMIWLGLRLIAFTIGLTLGWKAMKRW